MKQFLFALMLLGFCLLTNGLNIETTPTPKYSLPLSRAQQFFGVNCQMNKFMENEFALGLEYLNASMHMKQDRMALNGFGKMFNKFWLDQLESVNKIRSYLTKRGGLVYTPGFSFKRDLNSINFFENETAIVYKFLIMEKMSNALLHGVHNSTTEEGQIYEKSCLRYEKRFRVPKNYLQNVEPFRDPVSANFLDQHFSTMKTRRIEFLSHLIRRISRLDQHPTHMKGGVRHFLNQLGIHMIDNELTEKF